MGVHCRGTQGIFWGDENVLYLDWGSGYMDLLKFIKPRTFKMDTFYYLNATL